MVLIQKQFPSYSCSEVPRACNTEGEHTVCRHSVAGPPKDSEALKRPLGHTVGVLDVLNLT